MKRLFFFCFASMAFLTLDAQQNWLQGAGGNANDEALDMVQDASGNTYSCGYFSQAARFDNILVSSAGMGDVFVAKQDPLGNFIWVSTAGGVLEDKAMGISLSTTGDIYITGVFSGNSSFGSTNLSSASGSQDIYIAKLNNSGSFMWAHRYGGSDIDIATDIAVDQHGSLLVSGQFKGAASYGSTTLTSASYPASMVGTGGLPSFDALLFKTNCNGIVSWAKQGAADYDDRILRVATDYANNIFVCGQFSDTITFSSTYNNNAFNSGMLMKMDSTGTETWFRRILATQLMIYDLKVSGTELFLTGDFNGTLVYKGVPNNYLTAGYQHKLFVIKAQCSTGDYLAGNAEGSDNMLSSRGIAVDASGDVYITGFFKCSFSPFSLSHGNGVFYSVGYRDIFVIKYSSTLIRQWEKHFGGIGDDYPTALCVKTPDHPTFCGSYSKNFIVPDGVNFYLHLANISTHTTNFGSIICGNPHYGSFVTQNDWGAKDILLSQPVDLVCPLYDYFKRVGGTCTLDTLMPVRYPAGDTLTACDSILMYVVTPTTVDSLQAPDWTYTWSSGSSLDTARITSSGWHYISYGYADNCRRFIDSFYVQLFVSPPTPVITVQNAFVMSAIPAAPCLKKATVAAGDTAMFIASGIPAGYNMHWIFPGGGISPDDTILAYVPGTYSLIVETPGGLCSNNNCISLFNWNTGSGTCSPYAFVPQIIFSDSVAEATDTVTICVNDLFEMQLVDSTLYGAGLPTALNTFATWHLSGGFSFSPYLSFANTFGTHIQNFRANSSGPCSVDVDILDPTNGSVLATVTRNFYLDVHSAPPNNPVITGSSFFCPGDTVILTISGGASYLWSGPGIISLNSPANDSAFVGMEGDYFVTSVTSDPVLGCPVTAYASFVLSSNPAPLVTMSPPSGIVCPMDSVMLTAENGSGYTWYGPTGIVIGTTQDIWTSTPGIYYYTFTSASGCPLVSEMAEVQEYSTPYLDGSPGTSICPGGTVTINVESNPDATIVWSSPFSGSASSQVVSSPGIYTVSVSSCAITTVANITITAGSPPPMSITYGGNDTICMEDTVVLMASGGFDTYTWMPAETDGQVYIGLGGGTFTVEGVTTAGCSNMDTITIYSHPEVPAPFSNDTTVCAGSTILLTAHSGAGDLLYWYSDLFGGAFLSNGDSITVNIGEHDTAFYVSAFNGICFSERTAVNVFISPGSQTPLITGSLAYCMGDTLLLEPDSVLAGVTYTWNGPGISNVDTNQLLIYPVTISQSGTYSLYSTSGTCTSGTDSIHINVHDIHLQNFSSATANVCQYDSLILSTDILPGAYLWNTGNIFNSLSVNTSGDYFYTYTDSLGCSFNSDTVTVTVLPAPSSPQVADTAVCMSTPLTLNAGISGTTVNWYNMNDSLVGTGINYFLGPATMNTFLYIEAVDTNGCHSLTDTMQITIVPPPLSPLLSVADTLCITDSILLTASTLPGYNYYWNGPSGFSSSLEDPIINSLGTANSGVYSLYVVNGYCISDTASLTINVDSLPQIIITNNPTICIGDTALLTAGGNVYNASWSTGATGSSIEVWPLLTTLYMVSASNVCGTAVQNVIVHVNALPVIYMTGPNPLIVGESGFLNASGGLSYSWYPSTGLSCTSCPDPSVTTGVDMMYYCTVTDSNQCVNVDSFLVHAEEVYTLYIPNSFSPDGNGLNDRFNVIGHNVNDFSMRIYNRDGNLVYISDNINESWDGKSSQATDEPGVYVYLIRAAFENGQEKEYKGTVTIIK
jgi:gliding motility-associated-like protein